MDGEILGIEYPPGCAPTWSKNSEHHTKLDACMWEALHATPTPKLVACSTWKDYRPHLLEDPRGREIFAFGYKDDTVRNAFNRIKKEIIPKFLMELQRKRNLEKAGLVPPAGSALPLMGGCVAEVDAGIPSMKMARTMVATPLLPPHEIAAKKAGAAAAMAQLEMCSESMDHSDTSPMKDGQGYPVILPHWIKKFLDKSLCPRVTMSILMSSGVNEESLDFNITNEGTILRVSYNLPKVFCDIPALFCYKRAVELDEEPNLDGPLQQDATSHAAMQALESELKNWRTSRKDVIKAYCDIALPFPVVQTKVKPVAFTASGASVAYVELIGVHDDSGYNKKECISFKKYS